MDIRKIQKDYDVLIYEGKNPNVTYYIERGIDGYNLTAETYTPPANENEDGKIHKKIYSGSKLSTAIAAVEELEAGREI